MSLPLEVSVLVSLLDRLPVALYVIQDAALLWCNDMFCQLCEHPRERALGQSFVGFVAPEDREFVTDRYRRRVAGEAVPDHYEFSVVGQQTGKRTPIHMSVAVAMVGDTRYTIGIVVDMTTQRQIAAGLAPAVLAEYTPTTPVLRVAAGVLVVPLVGHYYAARIQDLTQSVLAAISRHQARALILDVTGLQDTDERIADYLARTAAAARLLGARCLLAGVSPALALLLLRASDSLSLLTTAATLEDALAMVRAPVCR